MALVIVALSIYALIDAIKTDSSSTPGRISKPIWIVFIAIVPILGPLGWLLMKNQDLFKSSNPLNSQVADRGWFTKKDAPRGPVAPDDDPDFLARLEAQNRRRAYEQKRAEEDPEYKAKSEQEDDDEGDDSRGLYGRR